MGEESSSVDPAAEKINLEKNWPQKIENFLVDHPSLLSKFQGSKVEAVTETHLTIGLDPKFKECIDEVKRICPCQGQNFFSHLLKRNVCVEIVIAGLSPAQDTSLKDPLHEQINNTSLTSEYASDQPEEWVHNPAIRNVLETFHGDIIEIKLQHPKE